MPCVVLRGERLMAKGSWRHFVYDAKFNWAEHFVRSTLLTATGGRSILTNLHSNKFSHTWNPQ